MSSKPIRRLASQVRQGSLLRLRQGTVDAINSDGTVDVTIAGDDVVVEGVAMLGAAPAGTGVWMLQQAGDLLALGAPAAASSGSNTNGDWHLLPSGLQVCTDLHLVSANPTTWTFPRAFAANPEVYVTGVSTGARFATWSNRSATSVDVHVWNTAAAFPGDTNVSALAVGPPV